MCGIRLPQLIILVGIAPTVFSADEVRLIVRADPVEGNNGVVRSFGFEESDVRNLRTHAEIEAVLPSRSLPMDVRAGKYQCRARVTGISAQLQSLAGIEIQDGRLIDEGDVRRLYSVAVLSESLGRKLFPMEIPVGRRIRIGSVYLQIIGVAESESIRGDALFIPISTLRARFGKYHLNRTAGVFDVESCLYDQIDVVAKDAHDTTQIRTIVQDHLQKNHPDRKFRFEVRAGGEPSNLRRNER